MLPILTLILAMTFSASNVPPQTRTGDLHTSGVSVAGDQQTPGRTVDPPDVQGGVPEEY